MNCNNCGNTISENNEFCPNCGAKNERNESQANFNNNTQSFAYCDSNEQINIQMNSMNNNMNINDNDEGKNTNKNFKYYKKLLVKDTIALLIMSGIGIIIGSIGSMDLFMSCCLYTIFCIIMLYQSKENKKFIGDFAIIIASIIIVISLIGSSLLSIVFIILGIFYIIHAIKYKRYLKIESNQSIKQELIIEKQKSYLPYISITLTVLSIALSKFMISLFGDVISMLIIFTMNVISTILCIIALKKYKKNALTYICIVFAIILSLIFGGFLAEDLLYEVSEMKYENSKEKIANNMYYAKNNIIEIIY